MKTVVARTAESSESRTVRRCRPAVRFRITKCPPPSRAGPRSRMYRSERPPSRTEPVVVTTTSTVRPVWAPACGKTIRTRVAGPGVAVTDAIVTAAGLAEVVPEELPPHPAMTIATTTLPVTEMACARLLI